MLANTRHRVSLESVATVLTYVRPAVQRGIDAGHVERMVVDQAAEHARSGCFSLLQSITVASLGGRVFVLDGQHRIAAYDELRRRGFSVAGTIIPVVHYGVADVKDLAELYTRINQHKPVHPLELRDTYQSFERPFIDWLCSTYAAYMKPGAGTRSPHIGVEQLKTELQKRSAELVAACGKRESGVSSNALCDAVAQFNAHMTKISLAASDTANANAVGSVDVAFAEACQKVVSPELRKRFAECLHKAEKNVHGRPCFLGAFRRFEWLDVCIFYVRRRNSSSATSSNTADADGLGLDACWALVVSNGGSAPSSSSFGSSTCRRKSSQIPYAVREAVWAKKNASRSNVGSCYTCGGELLFKDMECGHVIAKALGGSTEVDNLMPVCRTCNRDMGIQNLEAYRKRVCDMKGDAPFEDADDGAALDDDDDVCMEDE